MSLLEFVSLLKGLDYPIAHSHFKVDAANPAPQPPFITYVTPSTANKMADNKVYYKMTDVDVELYTRDKDLVAEQKIEAMFDEHSIPYNATQVWIESEQVFQKIYETRLI